MVASGEDFRQTDEEQMVSSAPAALAFATPSPGRTGIRVRERSFILDIADGNSDIWTGF
jgi:hypothetical protein